MSVTTTIRLPSFRCRRNAVTQFVTSLAAVALSTDDVSFLFPGAAARGHRAANMNNSLNHDILSWAEGFTNRRTQRGILKGERRTC